MSYTEVFGGETIAPTQLSYIAYESAVDVQLTWPLESPPDANVAADKIDVDMTVAALALIMPPADQISVGQDVLVRNVGSNTFSVTDFDGTEIGSVASGEAWYFVVIDNATEAGDWYAIEFGAGTSSATAAALAGAGLRAAANRLDQNLPTTPLAGAYAITANDRATVLQNTGGTVVWTFASAVTLTEGWFVYVINAGTGSITLTAAGGETIDGSATKVIAPTESLIVFSDGVNLHSLGYGRSIINTISGVSINAAGMGTMVLTDTQVQAQIQDFVGTLTGDRIAEYGGVVGYWFVFNNTTGAFTLTLRTDSLDPGALVPQGSYSIVRSNGTNMDIAFTASSGTVTNIATGAGLTGGPITTTGTISMLNTTVIAGAYGAVDRTITTTVNSRGQLTAITQPLIAIPISQVNVMTSAELAARVSDETGSGALVFATNPTIGTPAAITLTNATGLPMTTGVTGTLPVANGGTGVTTSTGTVAVVLSNSPALTGTPTSTTAAAGTNTTQIATTAFVTVQTVSGTNTASSSATGDIPYDDTIPQSGEGDLIITQGITPRSTTSVLTVSVSVMVTGNTVMGFYLALFKDAETDARKATATVISNVGTYTAVLTYSMVSGTTSPITFSVRGGGPSTWYLNGNGGGRIFGGAGGSNIVITETP